MIFSLKCIKQLSDFKNNQRFRGNELLQATYMSIFSRYNDNRDRSNNIFVSRDLIDEVIREEHEIEIGKIYTDIKDMIIFYISIYTIILRIKVRKIANIIKNSFHMF